MTRFIFVLLSLIFNGLYANGQKLEYTEVKLRDTVLPAQVQYPLSIDFILNQRLLKPFMRGLPEKNTKFRVKQYPMKRLFESAGDTDRLSVLVIGNRKDYKVVLDMDRDGDFSNDKVFSKIMLDSGINISFSHKKVTQSRVVRIFPFDTLHKFGAPEEQQWQMSISSWPAYKYGILKSGLAEKQIFFLRISLFDQWQKDNSIIFYADYEPNFNNQYFTTKDSIYFSKNVFILDSVAADGSSAYFKKGERLGKCGTTIGDSLCYVNDLVGEDGKPIRLPAADENKLLVYHFWGSWCAPCLGELSELEAVTQKFSSQAMFIHVASEHGKNLQPAENILKKHPGFWNNIFEFSNDAKLINRFGIVEFPSYVVVSPDGFYVNKFSGTAGLRLLKEFIDEYRK